MSREGGEDQSPTDRAYLEWAKEERRICRLNRRANLAESRRNAEYNAELEKLRPWEVAR